MFLDVAPLYNQPPPSHLSEKSWQTLLRGVGGGSIQNYRKRITDHRHFISWHKYGRLSSQPAQKRGLVGFLLLEK